MRNQTWYLRVRNSRGFRWSAWTSFDDACAAARRYSYDTAMGLLGSKPHLTSSRPKLSELETAAMDHTYGMDPHTLRYRFMRFGA
jgi:hypothetical protein